MLLNVVTDVTSHPSASKPSQGQEEKEREGEKVKIKVKRKEQVEVDRKRKDEQEDKQPSTVQASTEESDRNLQSGFHSLGLSKEIVHHVLLKSDKGGLGLQEPTEVQQKAIKAFQNGKDLIVKSETGSGKTLAFVLPIMNVLHQISPRIRRTDGVYALILAPTRELCYQITTVIQSLLNKFHWIVASSIVGGEKRKSEKARLRKGCNILVATPGRLTDHLAKTQSLTQSLSKGNLRFLVLDEADRLSDSGFRKQVDVAMEALLEVQSYSKKKSVLQTLMVSATLNANVDSLANQYCKDPVRVEARKHAFHSSKEASPVTETSKQYMVPKGLVQHYVIVNRKQRLVALAAFVLRQVKQTSFTAKMIVFVSCKAEVEFLYLIMSAIKWPPPGETQDIPSLTGLGTKWWRLHGGVDSQERRKTLKSYVKAKGGVLVCTDVAARGLDLPSVDWIIQFDPPTEIDDYVHRVGRTARKGRNGSAVLFLCPAEEEYLELLKAKQIILKSLSFEKFLTALVDSKYASAGGTAKGNIARRAKYDSISAGEYLQIKIEDLVDMNPEKVLKRQPKKSIESQPTSKLKASAEDAYIAFIRAYAVHCKESKHIFHPKKLHLGHVAQSFGLRNPPLGISKSSKDRFKLKRKKTKFHQNRRDFEKKAKRVRHQVE